MSLFEQRKIFHIADLSIMGPPSMRHFRKAVTTQMKSLHALFEDFRYEAKLDVDLPSWETLDDDSVRVTYPMEWVEAFDVVGTDENHESLIGLQWFEGEFMIPSIIPNIESSIWEFMNVWASMTGDEVPLVTIEIETTRTLKKEEEKTNV